MRRLRKLLRDPRMAYRDSRLHQRVRAVAARARGTAWIRERAPELSIPALARALTDTVGVISYRVGEELFLGVLDSERRSAFAVLLAAQRELAEGCLEIAALVGEREEPATLLRDFDERLRRANSWRIALRSPGPRQGLTLEFWRKTRDGFFCPGVNPIARKIYSSGPGAEAFKRGQAFDLRSLHACPLDDVARFDVDFVYTWVDHTDPAWRAAYELHAPEAAAASRKSYLYHNRDELRYSLRSVARFAPWARRIFIVTNCRAPAWLEVDHPKIVLVDHAEILPSQVLPTFNSHVIESALHRIAGLSEHFLYLNDDMAFSSPVSKEDFFLSSGLSKSCLEPHGMVNGFVSDEEPAWLNAARNGKRLIEATFGVSPVQLHEHVPYALRRCVLEAMEREYAEQYARLRANRFRSASDISIPSFLYHHFAYQREKAVRASIASVYLTPRSLRSHGDLRKVFHGQYAKVLCINDSEPCGVDLATWDRAVARCLEGLYPEKCEFER
jgi:hypothetical protein